MDQLDLTLIRAEIFDALKSPYLKKLNESEFQSRIFEYLNSIEKHSQLPSLKKYSEKLENLKSKFDNYLSQINAAFNFLETDLEWLNSSKSLSVKNDLKGKLVVVDFWTYCCINCMHIMPLINRLEHEFDQVGDIKTNNPN